VSASADPRARRKAKGLPVEAQTKARQKRAEAREQALVAERRGGKIAGLAALASVGCWVAALMFANAVAGENSALSSGPAFGQGVTLSRKTELTEFHAGVGDQAIATALRCAGLLLTIAVGLYLYRIVLARRPEVSRWMLRSAIAGALLVCGATLFGYFALDHVANEFAGSGPRTLARANHLVDHSAYLTIAAILDFVSRCVFAFWLWVSSLEMMRAGLLDRFLGYWGFGACAALVLLPIGDAMFIGWLGSIGVLSLGYWPGGRPDAWLTITRAAQ
jgi:hypothetical protein